MPCRGEHREKALVQKPSARLTGGARGFRILARRHQKPRGENAAHAARAFEKWLIARNEGAPGRRAGGAQGGADLSRAALACCIALRFRQ